MRKISSLVLLLLWSVGLSAQTETEFAQKTRYIYLWDVTYSTVDWDKPEMCYNMSNFLIKDIRNKQNSEAEIIIIPFNDNVVESEIIRHTAADFNGIYSNVRESLKDDGYKWSRNHTSNGKTNVAGALKYAREKYADDSDYNNIILLLTDGYNEYDEHGPVKDKNKAKKYLSKEIKAVDEAITRNVQSGRCFNAFFYVIFQDIKKDGSYQWDDPRDGSQYENTRFITPDKGSINLHLIELDANIRTAQGGKEDHMNLRESKFTIELEGVGFDLLKASGKKLKVNVKSLEIDKLKLDKTYEVDYYNKTIEVTGVKINGNSDCDIKLSIKIANNKDFENDEKNYIKVWLKNQNLKLKVTQQFKPQITIRAK